MNIKVYYYCPLKFTETVKLIRVILVCFLNVA